MSSSSSIISLHVYDLSHGMARLMGGAILGFDIDYLPHTGVVVHGWEFFFGGGIQKQRPEAVVASTGLRPCERLELGRTTRTHDELDAWLRSPPVRDLWVAENYDLFQRNCNHFSDALVKWLTGGTTGIPSHIVNLPQRIRDTPQGARIYSMFAGSNSGEGGTDPFRSFSGSGVSGGAIASSPPTSPTNASGTTSSALSPLPPSSMRLTSPLPRVSYEDTAAAGLVVQRLRKAVAAAAAAAAAGAQVPSTGSALLPEETRLLDALAERLRDAPPAAWAPTACALAARAVGGVAWPAADTVFAGAILTRLLALRADCALALTAADATAEGGSLGALSALVAALAEGGGAAPSPSLAAAWAQAGARNQALQALVNAFQTPAGAEWATSPQVAPLLTGIVCAELRSPRIDLRSIAGALAGALAGGVPVTGAATSAAEQLLLGCLVGCEEEDDGETASRRLLAAGTLLVRAKREGEAALATLAIDVEVPVSLEALARDAGKGGPLRALAVEVLGVLRE